MGQPRDTLNTVKPRLREDGDVDMGYLENMADELRPLEAAAMNVSSSCV